MTRRELTQISCGNSNPLKFFDFHDDACSGMGLAMGISFSCLTTKLLLLLIHWSNTVYVAQLCYVFVIPWRRMYWCQVLRRARYGLVFSVICPFLFAFYNCIKTPKKMFRCYKKKYCLVHSRHISVFSV